MKNALNGFQAAAWKWATDSCAKCLATLMCREQLCAKALVQRRAW